MKSILIISHGSRSSRTKEEVCELIKKLKRLTSIPVIHYAFLELETPLIPQGIEQCVSEGSTEIIVLLNFLNSGRHVDVDIPRIICQAQKKFPQVTITITKPVGQHERIPDLFAQMLGPSTAPSL